MSTLKSHLIVCADCTAGDCCAEGLALGADYPPWIRDMDAKLGAALRAALADVDAFRSLDIHHAAAIGGPPDWWVTITARDHSEVTDATVALAALLRPSPPEGPQE